MCSGLSLLIVQQYFLDYSKGDSPTFEDGRIFETDNPEKWSKVNLKEAGDSM